MDGFSAYAETHIIVARLLQSVEATAGINDRRGCEIVVDKKRKSVNTVLSLQDHFISLNQTSTRPGEQSKVNTTLSSEVSMLSYQKCQVSHFLLPFFGFNVIFLQVPAK